jgi:integrase
MPAARRHQDRRLDATDRQAGAEFKKPIAALFDAAGLTDVRSHDLRRRFGSIAADEGFGDVTIAELLGQACSRCHGAALRPLARFGADRRH